ncbi:MAG: fumarylacetoacetate hydrolase family protein [Acidimicrobiales bacterium]
MRLTAFDDGGRARMAVVLGERVEPLSSVDEFYDDVGGWCAKVPQVSASGGSLELATITQVPPVPATAKVLCVGLNYEAHAAEGDRQLPSRPNIFARWASTLVADGDSVPLPVGEPKLDYEAELVVVVGAELHGADRRAAGAAVLGYACGNDITARGFQHNTTQWALGKNADRSGPMGPIVTADEVPDLTPVPIVCRLNGQEMQRSVLGKMIFKPDEILAYASGCLTLRPGDVVYTGTPEGVGFRRSPPRFMGAGDTVEVEIGHLGVLTNRIVARTEPTP